MSARCVQHFLGHGCLNFAMKRYQEAWKLLALRTYSTMKILKIGKNSKKIYFVVNFILSLVQKTVFGNWFTFCVILVYLSTAHTSIMLNQLCLLLSSALGALNSFYYPSPPLLVAVLCCRMICDIYNTVAKEQWSLLQAEANTFSPLFH